MYSLHQCKAYPVMQKKFSSLELRQNGQWYQTPHSDRGAGGCCVLCRLPVDTLTVGWYCSCYLSNIVWVFWRWPFPLSLKSSDKMLCDNFSRLPYSVMTFSTKVLLALLLQTMAKLDCSSEVLTMISIGSASSSMHSFSIQAGISLDCTAYSKSLISHVLSFPLLAVENVVSINELCDARAGGNSSVLFRMWGIDNMSKSSWGPVFSILTLIESLNRAVFSASS